MSSTRALRSTIRAGRPARSWSSRRWMPKRSRSGVVASRSAWWRRRAEARHAERDHARAGAAPTVSELRSSIAGVQGLLDRAREPVDLVDEEHGARLERGQERRDVGLALERGPAVCTNGTSSSAATIWASEVLPRPGGRPAARGRAPRRAWRRRRSRPRAARAAPPGRRTPPAAAGAAWPRGRRPGARGGLSRDSTGSTANTPGVRIGSGLTGGPRAGRRRSGPPACRRRRRAARVGLHGV